MSPLVKIDRFPIIDVRIPKEAPVEMTEELMATYLTLASRGQRMAMLVDLRGYDSAKSDANGRKKSAAAYRQAVPELRPWTVCEARIVTSVVARYVITAFDWLTGTPWPTATFTNSGEAEDWVRRQLAKDSAHFSRASA